MDTETCTEMFVAFCRRPKLETAQMSTNRKINQILVYPYKQIMNNNEKKLSTDNCNTWMDLKNVPSNRNQTQSIYAL